VIRITTHPGSGYATSVNSAAANSLQEPTPTAFGSLTGCLPLRGHDRRDVIHDSCANQHQPHSDEKPFRACEPAIGDPNATDLGDAGHHDD